MGASTDAVTSISIEALPVASASSVTISVMVWTPGARVSMSNDELPSGSAVVGPMAPSRFEVQAIASVSAACSGSDTGPTREIVAPTSKTAPSSGASIEADGAVFPGPGSAASTVSAMSSVSTGSGVSPVVSTGVGPGSVIGGVVPSSPQPITMTANAAHTSPLDALCSISPPRLAGIRCRSPLEREPDLELRRLRADVMPLDGD